MRETRRDYQKKKKVLIDERILIIFLAGSLISSMGSSIQILNEYSTEN
jgi:hypothetical protein